MYRPRSELYKKIWKTPTRWSLKRQSTELEPFNLAALFDEIQVEKEERRST